MKHSLLRWTAVLLVVLACPDLSAQTELKSRVVDFTTFMPVPSASVYVQNSTIGTISNLDGNFALVVPSEYANDTLVISSIGYKSFKTAVADFVNDEDIFLEEDIASLDEVLLVAETRPKTGNDIMLRALEELPENMPEMPYMQKAFLRHKERNKIEYKWLIESALTVYDSSYASPASKNLKINVDEMRKSYDLRQVDSLFTYYSYLKYHDRRVNTKLKTLDRDTIETASLVKAIKWNDTRVNGLDNLLQGKLNLVRNSNVRQALFGPGMLDKHQFELDTVLVENEQKVYKIRISKSFDYVGLNTPGVFNEGYKAEGWVYVYWDNYAIKRIEYQLVAASEVQRRRSRDLYDTLVNHRLVLDYKLYDGKMYPSYIFYETPKLVNRGFKKPQRDVKDDDANRLSKDERFYYTSQELLFTEIITDPETIAREREGEWDSDIFSYRPYNEVFWRDYNVLLESKEEQKLIQDLTQRASLFKQ